MNKIKIARTAAEKIIKHLQRYLKEQENFNVYIPDKDMDEIMNLIEYMWNKLN